MCEKIFDVLSEKVDYKAMYSNIPFVKTVFKYRRKIICSVCILKW